MPNTLSETYFEETIAEFLKQSPMYCQRSPKDFDIEGYIDRGMFTDFLKAQKNTWKRLPAKFPGKSEEEIINVILGEYKHYLDRTDNQGGHANSVLELLRNGLTVRGAKIKFMQQKPLSEDPNDEGYQLYLANRFAVVRQLRYSKDAADRGKEIDLAILCNGVPLLTCELKNEATGQTYADAIEQYKSDRNPANKLLQQFLVHFAMDNELVFMTTRLAGEATEFLPFNRETRNPPMEGTYPTAYMWRDIWQADTLMGIVGHFIKRYYDIDAKRYRVIFPRFHQLRCVENLVRECAEKGAGENYLVYHSAGSGKTKTMAWLAERLSELTKDGKSVYDVIVMVTDRIVLNGNMADEVNRFITTPGLVQDIRHGSKNLAAALNSGSRIIVSTVQKYAFALDALRRDKHRTYAIIIDEAHTAVGNEATKDLINALSTDEDLRNLPDFKPEECESEMEALMMYQQAFRHQQKHMSFFAFTATPKDKTLVLYGRDGRTAHDTYTMRQAIEEGFILDVLKNYVSYRTMYEYESNENTDENDTETYEKKKAMALIFEELSKEQYVMQRKTVMMVDHFAKHSINKINGRAKAMVVTDSRESAVRYKMLIDKYLKKKHLDEKVKTLVAFSGTVEYNGNSYTEASMNGANIKDDEIRRVFDKENYRLLIVANKFQTGFDQPLLHTMYVDKVISGIQCVQTLSRLNRCHAGKEDTLVIDFRNTADSVQKDFQRYYSTIMLTGEIDQQRVYQMKDEVDAFNVFSEEEVDEVCQFWVKKQLQAIPSIMVAIKDRAREMLSKEQMRLFRKAVDRYVRQYGFFAQVLEFTDPMLEKYEVFCRILV